MQVILLFLTPNVEISLAIAGDVDSIPKVWLASRVLTVRIPPTSITTAHQLVCRYSRFHYLPVIYGSLLHKSSLLIVSSSSSTHPTTSTQEYEVDTPSTHTASPKQPSNTPSETAPSRGLPNIAASP